MKLAIASGKGGAGKTKLSTNLAYYLVKNMVLTDLDLSIDTI